MIPKMLEGLITEDEKSFYNQGFKSGETIHKKDIALSFYLTGNLRKITEVSIVSINSMVDKVINSNKKHSIAMIALTAGLVFAGAAQVIVAIIK